MKPRHEGAGAIHHVFPRGNRKQPIFGDDEDRRLYLELLGGAIRKFGWRCLTYCLMDNHVHLLIETPEPNLGRGLGQLHSLYALRYNARHGQINHLFHRPTRSKGLESPASVMYVSAYIALNPVRAGMVGEPDEYRWSSHAAVMGAAEPPKWLQPARLLGYFDGGSGDLGPRDRYQRVVEAVGILGAGGFDPVTTADRVEAAREAKRARRAAAAKRSTEPRERRRAA